MWIAITRDKYDAVLLDFDGMITDTAMERKKSWLTREHPRAVRPVSGR